MKVALVHDWLNGMRGGEKILEVLAEIFPEAHIFTLLYEPEKISPVINRLKIATSFIQKMPWAKKYYRYYLPLFPFAVERFDLTGYDLVISTSHCVAKGVKVPEGVLHICYCFTPMRYVWDFSKEYFAGSKGYFLIKPFLWYLKIWDKRTSERPDYFLSISETVSYRIKKYYNRESKVIYPPVDTDFFIPMDKNEAGYYLIVSALVPYKMIDIAVKAFNNLGLPLRIIGSGTEAERLKKIAKPNIEFLGWQSDEIVRDNYAGCRGFIFPGVEDFGITILEAQSCGRPVIAYRAGGAEETVEDSKTGIFFPEQTEGALIEAVKRFEKIGGMFDKEAMRRNALKYNKKRFKEEIKNEIQNLYSLHYGSKGNK